jgi:hypothetical protein
MRVASRGVAAFVAMSATLGCASITTNTTYTEQAVRRHSKVTPLEDSTRYIAKATVKGDAVLLSLTSEQQCEVAITPIFHKYAHHERTVADTPGGTALQPASLAIYGLVLGAAGLYGYADADSLASQSTDGTTATDYRNSGLTITGIGAVLLVVAGIDALRLVDDDEDLGEVKHEREVSQEACKRHPVSGQRVVLALRHAREKSGEWRAGELTDDDGNVSIGLAELPESAFHDDQLELVANVEDGEANVLLSEAATTRLMEALVSNPQSRISRDRDTALATSCQQQVLEAKSGTVSIETSTREIQLLERRWSQAKSVCEDKWSKEYEDSMAAFHEAVEQTARERAARACDDAGQRALTAFDEGGDEADDFSTPDLLEALRRVCTGSKDADAIVARVEARARKAETARARLAQRDALLAKLQERSSAHDASGFQSVLAKSDDARAALLSSGQAATITATLAQYWIEKAGAGTGNQSQLCAARSLMRLTSGDLEWSKLRRNAVERAGVAKGSKIASAMEACK